MGENLSSVSADIFPPFWLFVFLDDLEIILSSLALSTIACFLPCLICDCFFLLRPDVLGKS